MEDESPAPRAHRGLRILLNFVGVVSLVAVVALLFPMAWPQTVVDFLAPWLGAPDLGHLGPLFWYTARAEWLVFLGTAWMSFATARDPEHHRQFIHALMIISGAWVLLCPVPGYTTGMPLHCYMRDALAALVLQCSWRCYARDGRPRRRRSSPRRRLARWECAKPSGVSPIKA